MTVNRTSKGLTEVMFSELDALKNGDSTPQMARAKAAVANTICAITRLEMDFARFVNSERAEEIEKDAGLRALPMGDRKKDRSKKAA